ncbi:MAG: TCP-1/cpn60 chaperonin family protein [Anaerolineae bacterium]
MKAKQKPGVVFQPHVHRAMQRGIRKIVGAIRPTLGPLACGVAIDPLNDAETLPEYLDDGGLIARRIIELADRDEDIGAMMVRAMLTRHYEHVGDGTATLAVLFEAIFNAGVRYITAGGNAMQMRRHLESAIPLIVETLETMSVQLDGQIALTNMARSLCHEEDMAHLLGEAFDLIGEYGRLDIREDYGRVLRQEYVEGNYFHSGMFSRVMLPEDSVAKARLENAAIFLCDFEISDHKELFPVLQTANSANVEALVIIARSLSETAISLLVTHNKMDKFKIMAVKLPGLNPEDRMAALDDLSVLTGARPFLKITGDSLENIKAEHFGQARRVWGDARLFGMVGAGGNPAKLRQHVNILRKNYKLAQDVEDRKKLLERIGSLMGGSVTLWVGGFTEPEINSRKSLAQRAALVMRAAVEEGVVPGGGIALLRCRDAVNKVHRSAKDPDERAAYGCLLEALAAPARTIYRNAGYDPGEVIAQFNGKHKVPGFDVVGGQVVDMCDAGIFDSLLVLKNTVRNAIRTAGLALTIDSFVHLSAPEIIRNPT